MTPHHILVEKLCQWSNKKADLLEVGTPSKYPEFENFTIKDFEQYVHISSFLEQTVHLAVGQDEATDGGGEPNSFK